MYALSVLNLITPFVMILVGSILKKHPVKDMRTHNGYNTPTARKSQAHWDYAQEIAPEVFISLGKYLLAAEAALSVALWLLRVPADRSVTIGSCIGLGGLCYAFYYTDLKIKENFSEA